MSTPQDPSPYLAPPVNSLFYLDPVAYVLDAARAGMSREEVLQGLLLFTATYRDWPPRGDYEGFYECVVDAVDIGAIRPGDQGVILRPYDEAPIGIFSRVVESIKRRMGMLPDAVGSVQRIWTAQMEMTGARPVGCGPRDRGTGGLMGRRTWRQNEWYGLSATVSAATCCPTILSPSTSTIHHSPNTCRQCISGTRWSRPLANCES